MKLQKEFIFGFDNIIEEEDRKSWSEIFLR